MARGKSKFYAVAKGKHSYSMGIYTTWAEAKDHVLGTSRAHHCSFPTRAEAERWLKANVDERNRGALATGAVKPVFSFKQSNAVPAALCPAPTSLPSSSSSPAPKREQEQQELSDACYICATPSAEVDSISEHAQYFYRDVAVPLGNIPDWANAYDTHPPSKRFFDSDADNETDDEEDVLISQLLSSCRPSVWEEEEYIPLSPPSTLLPASSRRKRRKPTKFYAVPVGHLPGVYRTWAETEVQLKAFTDSYCKSDKDEGQAWLWYLNRYRRPHDFSDDEDSVGGVVIEQDEKELESSESRLTVDAIAPQRAESRLSSRSSSPELLPASSPPVSSPGHYFSSQPAASPDGPCVARLESASQDGDGRSYTSDDDFSDDDAGWMDHVPMEELDRLELQLAATRAAGTSDSAARNLCESDDEFADADADLEWMGSLTDDELSGVDTQR